MVGRRPRETRTSDISRNFSQAAENQARRIWKLAPVARSASHPHALVPYLGWFALVGGRGSRPVDSRTMTSDTARRRLVNRLAEKLGKDKNTIRESIERVWFDTLNKHKAQQTECNAARESASDQI